MKNTYVWYSGATNVTGEKIVKELGCEGGRVKPAAKYDNVLCWGAKTKEAVKLNNKSVFNHPDNIRTNRNKLDALGKMKGANVAVADYATSADEIVKKHGYPIIARTKYHQGGQGMWICLNKEMVSQALKEGAQYFQRFINIKNEYRLHVVGDKVIYAVKKVPRDNHKAAFKAHWSEHCGNYADKQGIKLDEKTVNLMLDKMGDKMSGTVDMITRSNTRGWKFSKVLVGNIENALVKQATDAVKSLGLDYGAVDCCIDVDGKPWIIEVNTGPGLDGSSFTAWIAALKKLLTPAKKAPAKKAAPKKAVAQAAADMGEKVAIKKADKLKAKANLFAEMLEAAGDDPVKLAAIEDMMGGAA